MGFGPVGEGAKGDGQAFTDGGECVFDRGRAGVQDRAVDEPVAFETLEAESQHPL